MGALVDFANKLEDFSYTDYCGSGANEYAVVIMLHLGTFIYILNKATNDYSWVDRIWSLLPIFTAVHLLYFQHECQLQTISVRQWIMFACIAVWGIRLTYNFWRKGGYSKGSG